LQSSLDITLVRVDNRLVHGQILEAWVPFLGASCIIVADDQVAADCFRESVIRMAVPNSVKVIVCRVDEFAETYPFKRGKGLKTIVLFSKISDASKVRRLGFLYDELNIGNIYNNDCTLCCTPTVFLSDADIHEINILRNAGVKIELRRVPRDQPTDVFEIVQKLPS
jgi:mannose/fructose/N-acetylgalactosamine-specific phosphotransferase system component IIB